MIWLGIIIGYFVAVLGNYFIRKDDLRQLAISREANDALRELLRLQEVQAQWDVYRWKCVALGEEWNPERPGGGA